jgi:hypothetical protein
MNISDFVDLCEYPDWRWTKVKAMLKDRQSPTERDDKYIHRGYKFAKALADCDGSDTTMFSLASSHRDVAKAVGLHNNKSNRKFFLEALALCADADEPKIAQYMGESQFMVRYYLKLFFDVRDKLGSPGYICARIMEPALLQAIQDCKDPCIAWKIAGMFGGFDAVRACWESRGTTKKVQQYFRDSGITTLLKDFSVGTFLRPVNKFNTEFIAGHVLKLAELEIQAQAAKGGQHLSEERVDMLKDIMGSIKFFVVDPNEKLPAREPRLYEKVDQSLVAQVVGANHE